VKAFVSWSGGKETVLACYKAMQEGNVKVSCFLNMLSDSGRHSRTHGVGAELLAMQAKGIGVPILQRKTPWKNYERIFKKAVLELKQKGIDTGVFGDIDLQEHRDWVERVCKETGIKPLLPLWNRKRESIIEEFIELGFKAVVCATNASYLGKEWLGRRVDKDYVDDLRAMEGVDLCGEKGEYHTFVYDGPIFKKAVKISHGKKVFREKHWFLELTA
jgi:uncharacterized protein (TIGR00290 family)